MLANETQFTHALNKGDVKVFEEVYKLYFKSLHAYAYTIVKDEIAAEEIVQNIFMKLWERKEKIDIQISLKAYLYKSVYFESLNVLKHEKVKSNYQTQTTYVMKDIKAVSATDTLLHRNLEEKLRNALNELPEQCRTVFQLSRFEELKYREIASHLSISEKTVENHMGKALRLLRLKLADFVTIILLCTIILSSKFEERNSKRMQTPNPNPTHANIEHLTSDIAKLDRSYSIAVKSNNAEELLAVIHFKNIFD